MAAYFSILLIPSLFSVFNVKRVHPGAYYLTFVVFVLFVGFRYKVGLDWNNYAYIHQMMSTYRLSQVFEESEPLSYFLFWLSALYSNGTLITNIVAAIIALYGIFSFAGRTRFPWIAIVAATPYLIIVFSMSATRQAMAVGIIMWLYARWRESTLFQRLLTVFVASLFHTSAIINVIPIILALRLPILANVAVFGAMALIARYLPLHLVFYSDNIAFYQEAYLAEEDSIVSPGALMHVALVWIPAAAYLVFRKRLSGLVFDKDLMTLGSWLCVLLIGLYVVSSTGASRVTLYLYFVPMMFYPALVESFHRKQVQLVAFVVVAAHFCMLAIWLFYANNAIGHIPYGNVLLGQSGV